MNVVVFPLANIGSDLDDANFGRCGMPTLRAEDVINSWLAFAVYCTIDCL